MKNEILPILIASLDNSISYVYGIGSCVDINGLVSMTEPTTLDDKCLDYMESDNYHIVVLLAALCVFSNVQFWK